MMQGHAFIPVPIATLTVEVGMIPTGVYRPVLSKKEANKDKKKSGDGKDNVLAEKLKITEHVKHCMHKERNYIFISHRNYHTGIILPVNRHASVLFHS